MNNNQVITDEIIESFLIDDWSRTTKETIKAWEQFKASHQPPQNEWEVVELKPINGAMLLWEDHKKGWANDNNDWVENNLDYKCTIHKVRRTDGATLEVGKEYEIGWASGDSVKYKIIKIESLYEEGICIYFEGSPYLGYNPNKFCSIVECKEVLLVTLDGGALYQYDDVPYLDSDFFFGIYYNLDKERAQEILDKGYKVFSSKEKAKEFQKEHKPYLSIAMIREALEGTNRNEFQVGFIIKDIEQGLSKRKNNQ